MGGAVRHQDDESVSAGTAAALLPAVVVKGKRSKRQRVHAPPVVLTSPAEWSSSAASATPPAEEDSGTSPSVDVDEAASTGGGGGCVTEEEEDMARCLMLLSRGEPAARKKEAVHKDGEVVNKEARFRSRRPAADGAAAGEFVYECKTCNKCFPSFQALGGHRTSHKKPRLIPPPSSEDKHSNPPSNLETATTSPSLPPSPPSSSVPPAPEEKATDATVLAIAVPVPVVPKQEPSTGAIVSTAGSSSSRHPRVHECSICGAEFASGQALGGHMRRHRPLVPAGAAARGDDAPPRKEKSLLELDLNMPAPCDEADAASVTSPRFTFTAVAERKPTAMLFPAAAASALVDCHY